MAKVSKSIPSPSLQSAQDYYGNVLQSTNDLRTSACSSAPPRDEKVREALRKVHPNVSSRYYGCGSPIPPMLHNTTTLDLGCGTGRDCFVISQLAGSHSRVIGLDATESQLRVGQEALTWHTRENPNSAPVTFLEGDMSDLSTLIADESIDVVVSNCVLNLTSEKDAVFKEIARVLKRGGELLFADIFSSHQLDVGLQSDPVLHGECLAGAHYLPQLQHQLESIGMSGMYILASKPVEVIDRELQAKLGNEVAFTSLTVRAFKRNNSREVDGKSVDIIFKGDQDHCEFVFDRETDFTRRGDRKKISAEAATDLLASGYAPLFSRVPQLA